MSKKSLNPETLFNSEQYGFSQIVVAEGQRTVHFSGQVAWDEHENIVGENDLRAQVWQSLRNVDSLSKGTSRCRDADWLNSELTHMPSRGFTLSSNAGDLMNCAPTALPRESENGEILRLGR